MIPLDLTHSASIYPAVLSSRWAMLGAVGALIPEALSMGGVELGEPVWWKVRRLGGLAGWFVGWSVSLVGWLNLDVCTG